jgi:acetyl-CoA carboxylase carboxyl transferase subunit alpha
MDRYALPFEEPIREVEQQMEAARANTEMKGPEREKALKELEAQRLDLIGRIFTNLSPWDRVRIARHPSRPTSAEYLGIVFDEFIDVHGDRRFGEDKAIMAGFARINGEPIIFLGQQKGRTTKEKLACNFGMPHPEGYRKALRVMKMAEKFRLPVVTFIDTMGAYPGIGSEERGVAEAIAVNLLEMSRLRTPLISIVIGEGGSGGALGLGTGDRLLILEYAYYSVISPEGCAAILWRSADEARKAAEALKLTAKDLVGLGIMDGIIPEPPGGAHNDAETMGQTLKKTIGQHLAELKQAPIDRLLEQRYEKYRRIGYFLEGRVERSPVIAMAERAAAAERRRQRRERPATEEKKPELPKVVAAEAKATS